MGLFERLAPGRPRLPQQATMWLQLLETIGHVSGHCERQLLDQLQRGQEISPEEPAPQEDEQAQGFQPLEQDLEPAASTIATGPSRWAATGPELTYPLITKVAF